MHLSKGEIELQRKELAADPLRSAFHWEAIKDGLIVRAEFDVFSMEHKLAELEGLQPYEFFARSYRPEIQSPFVTIEPGMKPIWLFVANHGINLFEPGERIDSALIFGREHPPTANGFVHEECALVMPDGTMAGFMSVDTARRAFFDAVAYAQAMSG